MPLDIESIFRTITSIVITRARYEPAGFWQAKQQQNAPLRLLFAGYNGARNTGADVRVAEMIRQFRHVLGASNLDATALTFDKSLSQSYFEGVRQIEVPPVIFNFLYNIVRKQDGVVACEGSLFKSHFSDTLTTLMVGAYGLATAAGKLAIAYGGEADQMKPDLAAFVARHCREGLILCRNQASCDVLDRMGLKAQLGTDTAYTYDPDDEARAQAEQRLREAGWDGEAPLAMFAPVHPFWWPVRSDLRRFVQHYVLGDRQPSHYRTFFFHRAGEDVDAALDTYLASMASSARQWREQTGAQIVVIGMEAIDREVCEKLASQIGGSAPIFCSDECDFSLLISILNRAEWLVSSRFHAIVTSMLSGVVPIGVSMDERISNLMLERGTPQRCLRVDEAALGPRILEQLNQATAQRQEERLLSERMVVANLRRLGEMGRQLERYVSNQRPDLHLPSRDGDAPWSYLPPLSARLEALVERHGDRAVHPSPAAGSPA